MAFTLNRRLAQLVDSNGQLNTGKIPNDYITGDHIADNVITSAMLHTSFTVSTSNLTAIDTDDVSEGSTNLYFTNARVDTEIDSYLSGGTGVTYSSGAISIGQDVGTTATPTFGNITTTGYIAGPATFTIDPAAVGDNTGTVVIAGNLQVDGTTTTINSTTLTVDDKLVTLASGSANAGAANGAGIEVDISGATNPSILYDGTNSTWDFNNPIDVQLIRADTLNNRANSANIIYRSSTNTIVGNNASALVVQDGGNVGIGTDSPDSILHIEGSGVDSLRFGNIGPSNNSALRISRDDDSITTGNPLGYLEFGGKDNTGNVDTAHAYVGAIAEAPHSAGDNATALIFGTTEDNSSSLLERMRIDGSGNVGIGVTAGEGITSGVKTLSISDAGSKTTGDKNGVIAFKTDDGSYTGTYSDAVTSEIYSIAESSTGAAYGLGFLTGTISSTNRAERLRINNIGQVSIGTTSALDNATLTVKAAYDTNTGIHLQEYDTSNAWGLYTVKSDDTFRITRYASAAYSDKLVIKSNGYVGIGVENPQALFVVNNNGATNNAFYVDVGNGAEQTLFEHTGSGTPVPFVIAKSGYSGTSQEYGILDFHMAHNTVGGGSNIHFSLKNSSNTKIEYGGIGASIVDNTASSEDGKLHLYVTRAGNTREEKVTIKSDGYVGIGETNPGEKLHIKNESSNNLILKLENESTAHETYTQYMCQDGGFFNIGISSDAANYAFFNTDQGSYRWFGGGGGNPGMYYDGNLKIGSGGAASFTTGEGLEIEKAGTTTLRLQNTSTSKTTELNQESHFVIEAQNSSMDISLQPTRVVDVQKPIHASTDSGTNFYTHLCTGSFYSSANTGVAIHTNIPGHNQSGNANMFSFRVTGYWYGSANGGAIDIVLGCYSGEGNFYNTTVTGTMPEEWVGEIQFFTNPSGKVTVFLGTTSGVARCELAVTDFVQGFQNVNESYAVGWTMSTLSSLSGYSNGTKAIYRDPKGIVIDGIQTSPMNTTSTSAVVLSTSATYTPMSKNSHFKIDIFCNVNTTDDASGGSQNQNPYRYGRMQRSINGGSWTDCDDLGVDGFSQGATAAHIELSPPRVGHDNTDPNTWMSQQDRYRTTSKYSCIIDDPNFGDEGQTIAYRLVLYYLGGNSFIQIGVPNGFNTDDNYPVQPYGFVATEILQGTF